MPHITVEFLSEFLVLQIGANFSDNIPGLTWGARGALRAMFSRIFNGELELIGWKKEGRGGPDGCRMGPGCYTKAKVVEAN